MNTFVIKLFAISLSMFGLVACHDFGHQRYHVDGATTDFCVPDSNTVEDVWYAPKTKYDASAFAFQGCYGVETGGAPCPPDFLDGGIGGGVVESLRRAQPTRWGEIKDGNGIVFILKSHNSVRKVVDDGKRMIVYATDGVGNISFLLVIDKISGGVSNSWSFNDDDSMAAACISGVGERLDCNRDIIGNDFSLQYWFSATLQQLAEINFGKNDQLALATINGWRCSKRR